jgi:hypothetical protein
MFTVAVNVTAYFEWYRSAVDVAYLLGRPTDRIPVDGSHRVTPMSLDAAEESLFTAGCAAAA